MSNGGRKELILSYVTKNDEKKNPGINGLRLLKSIFTFRYIYIYNYYIYVIGYGRIIYVVIIGSSKYS